MSVIWMLMFRFPQLPSTLKSQWTYQISLFGIAIIVFLVSLIFAKDSVLHFIAIGDLSNRPGEVNWLGISSDETWKEMTLSLSIIISIVTFGFMYYAARKLKISYFEGFRRYWVWITFFSLMNSFSEEIIFRLALIGAQLPFASPIVATAISAVVFGLAHFRGAPGGLSGMIISGILGWILAKSMIDTGGVFVCLFIHFLQDLLIFPVVLHPQTENSVDVKVGDI